MSDLPINCPNCGAEIRNVIIIGEFLRFQCGSYLGTKTQQSAKCRRIEAPRLKAQIATLTRQLAERDAEIESLKERLQGVKWNSLLNDYYLMVDGRCAATVWSNGVWHTWDEDGIGGENSSEKTVAEAKAEALLSALTQGFLFTTQPPEPAGEGRPQSISQ